MPADRQSAGLPQQALHLADGAEDPHWGAASLLSSSQALAFW